MQLVEVLMAPMERAGGKGKGDLSSQGLEVAQLWRSLGSLWGAVMVIAGMAQRGQPLDVGIEVTPHPDRSGAQGWQGQGDHGGMVQW